MRKYILLLLVILNLLLFTSSFALGESQDKTINVTRIEKSPDIDGYLDDKCWQGIKPVTGFYQYDPHNGDKPSEKTFVWIAYDKDNVYFGFKMKDSKPDKIWAELTPRNEYEDNDTITVILDTYNDKRTSISFTVNPKGVQKNSVETIWKSDAAIQDDGWTAEMAIPFKSLRFPSKKIQTWGVNFKRYIYRLNETDLWTNAKRDIQLLQQMGTLTGLRGVSPGYNIELFPYLGVRSSRWEEQKDDKLAYGMDFKYGILPNLILDMTVSPDFSEVESDPFIYQLSPYETFFSERRPFFTEGSQYFRLPTEHGWHTDSMMFYSRRIGNPKFAAKLSGKTGGYAFGVIGAINDEPDAVDDSIFSVIRIQKDVLKNSQVGIMYTGKKLGNQLDQNFVLDYDFNIKDIYYLQGYSAFSFEKNSQNKNNGMHVLEFEREPDEGLQLNMSFKRIEKKFKAETGYLTRTDYQNFSFYPGYNWRFSRNGLQHLGFYFGGNLYQDSSGNKTGNNASIGSHLEFSNRMFLRFEVEGGKRKYQVYDDNYDLKWSDESINRYGANMDLHWYRGGLLKDINVEFSWYKRGIYNEEFTDVMPGESTSLESSLDFRPMSNFEFSVGADWTRQILDETGEKIFDGMTYETGLHYQITRYLFFNTQLKGETRNDQYNLDVLLGYYFGAGNVVQLCYKKSGITYNGLKESGYSITLKVSYLFRV